MGKREPWPLLVELDALLAREGWQEEHDPSDGWCFFEPVNPAVMKLERRILAETNLDIELDYYDRLAARWITNFYDSEDRDAPPFLRSRDAAAMLEEAVARSVSDDYIRFSCVGIYLSPGKQIESAFVSTATINSRRQFRGSATATSEAAARTRAALDAGHRLGIWPKPRPS